MTTKNIFKHLARGCAVFLVCFCIAAGMAENAWAAYEVANDETSTSTVPVGIKTSCTEDLVVTWQRPDMGSDTLIGYLYKWNTSDTSLNSEDGAASGFTEQMDGSVADITDPYQNKAKEDLTALDSGSELFLHVITHYQVTDGGEERVSADVVFGPFWIDNVAPTGTIRIVDANGDETTWTQTTTVNVKLAASQDTLIAYLNESDNILTSLQIDPYSVDAAYPLADTTQGEKTIYAWFEDGVGNISSTPVTATVTLVGATYINPYTATIDLTAGGVMGFSVEGTSATYNWSIINEKNEDGTAATAGTIATITVGGETNSVTVQALAEGTFQLQATPTAGGDPLTSGEITVSESATPGDVDGDGDITLPDVRLAFRFFLGVQQATAQQFASANVYDDGDGGSTITLHDVRGVFRLFLGVGL